MRLTTREAVGNLETLRHSQRATVVAFDRAAQDFPLLPTSLENQSPSLPDEAGDGLSPAQRLAIAAIVAGQTYTTTARAAGVSRRALFTWRQKPEFKHAVDQLSAEALDAAVTRVRNLMLRATRVMSEAMVGHDGPRAAYRVLNSSRLWRVLESTRPAEEDSPEAPDSQPETSEIEGAP